MGEAHLGNYAKRLILFRARLLVSGRVNWLKISPQRHGSCNKLVWATRSVRFFWVGGNRRIDGGVTTRWAQSRQGTLQTNTTIKFWDSHRLKLGCLLPTWAPKFVFVTLNQPTNHTFPESNETETPRHLEFRITMTLDVFVARVLRGFFSDDRWPFFGKLYGFTPTSLSIGPYFGWWLGGGFNFFYFHLYLGKIPILTNIFQRGWNHQPDDVFFAFFPITFNGSSRWMILQDMAQELWISTSVDVENIPCFIGFHTSHPSICQFGCCLNLKGMVFFGTPKLIHSAPRKEDPGMYIPWKSKDHWKNRFSPKTVVFAGFFQSSQIGDYNFTSLGLPGYVCESRAETHERFYMIEVHRHRFDRNARKVPFEKCEDWRKVCVRFAKDQIGDSIYSIIKLCK